MIGEILYQVRRKRGWTLAEAADRIGIHKSTLCRYEMEKIRQISSGNCRKISCAYGIPEGWIYRALAGEYPENWPEILERGEEGVSRIPSDVGNPLYVSVRCLSEEEVAACYRRLDERGRLRVSMLMLAEEG